MKSSILCFGFSLLLIVVSSVVMAQQVPSAGTPADPSAISKAELTETISRFERKEPTVAAVLTSSPDTPQGWLFTADVLAKHGEANLAKKFLQKLVQANLDQDGWLKLTKRYGSGIFERIGANGSIQPEGKMVAEAAFGALHKKLGDPQRIEQLIAKLQDPSHDVRIRAIAGLRDSGSAAVVPLLKVLADPKRKAEFTEVRSVLEYIDVDAQRQLIAAARSPNPTLAIQSIEVLKQTRATRAAIYLLGPATLPKGDPAVQKAAQSALKVLIGSVAKPDEAVQVLTDRARQYLDRLDDPIRAEDVDRTATIWQWDQDMQAVAATEYPARLADAVVATMLAKDAFMIDPKNEKSRQVYLMAEMERLGLMAEGDASIVVQDELADQITRFGPGPIMTTLENALLTDRTTAAITAIKLLGRFGPDQMKSLLQTGIKPTPLVRATRSGNPHLRFAALEVILALRPTMPFPGSSYVSEGLQFTASSTGARRAIVAARTLTEANRVGGFLTALGYEVETATTGNEMMMKLARSPDFEVVFIDDRIEKPNVNILVQKLHRDGRMAGLPVVVMSFDGQSGRAERAAAKHPLAEAYPSPQDQKTAAWQLAQVLPRVVRSSTTPELRLRYAAVALGHLNRLAESKDQLFAVRPAESPALGAIYLPELSEKAITLLGKLGTPAAQKSLVDLASSELQPIEDRQKALAAFQKCVEQKGVLLTTDQILLQYHRYNTSANSDRATQQVLGKILDSIEGAKPADK
ncbi:MAG: hypothetical protein PVH19_01420 [Planctomycetia bacterium]|jgi:CheY-like chemotaxis protein